MYYSTMSNGTFQKLVALRVYPWPRSTNKQVTTAINNYNKYSKKKYETTTPRTILYRKNSRSI
jgi:hypothetical protein